MITRHMFHNWYLTYYSLCVCHFLSEIADDSQDDYYIVTNMVFFAILFIYEFREIIIYRVFQISETLGSHRKLNLESYCSKFNFLEDPEVALICKHPVYKYLTEFINKKNRKKTILVTI